MLCVGWLVGGRGGDNGPSDQTPLDDDICLFLLFYYYMDSWLGDRLSLTLSLTLTLTLSLSLFRVSSSLSGRRLLYGLSAAYEAFGKMKIYFSV